MTESTVEIRSFHSSPEEAEQCKNTIRSVWIDHGLPEEKVDKFLTQHEMDNIEKDYLDVPRSHWWVAVDQNTNKLVGTLAAQPLFIAHKDFYDDQIARPYFPHIHPDQICELKRFTVLSQYQKQKVGYRLLLTLLEFARQNQYQAVHLISGLDWKEARHFYVRSGFERGRVLCFSKAREEADEETSPFSQQPPKIFESINDLCKDDWEEIHRPVAEAKFNYVQHYWMKL